MDKELFLRVRKNIELFYYGKGVIVDYNSSTITYAMGIEIDILKMSDGKLKIKEIIALLKGNEEQIINAIIRLMEKGIVIARKKQQLIDLKFYGEYGLFYPKEIDFELTDKCNYNCPFCYRNASANGTFCDKNMIFKLLDFIGSKVKYVQITGGEPTLHPDFDLIVEALSQKDIHISMISNGSILFLKSRETLSKISDMQLSMYGRDNYEYKKNTGIDDGFTRLQKSVDLLKELSIPFVLSITLHKNNIEFFEEYIKCAIGLGADRIKVGVANIFGREKKIDSVKGEYAEKKQTINNEYIQQLKKKYRSKIKIIFDNFDVKKRIDNEKDVLLKNKLKCGAGVDYLVISPDGYIRPCLLIPNKELEYDHISNWSKIISDTNKDMILIEAVRKIFQEGFYYENNISPCWSMKDFYETNILKGNV